MNGDTLTEDAPAQSIPNVIQAKPSHWEPEFESNSIIEWHCGECHKIVYYACWNATYCPHCGAPIFNFPRRKLDSPQHRGMSYSDQEKMRYAGPDRLPRMEAKRKAASGSRSGKSTRNK